MRLGETVNMARALSGIVAIAAAATALAASVAYVAGNLGSMPDPALGLSLELGAWSGLAAAVFSTALLALAIASPKVGARSAPRSIVVGFLLLAFGLAVSFAASIALSAVGGMSL